MTTNPVVDAARVELLLHELRLPSIRLMWTKLAEQSDKEGWPAARFLAVLAEHQMADRAAAALSGISSRRGCCPPARRSPRSNRRRTCTRKFGLSPPTG